jgi:hypothetical protein
VVLSVRDPKGWYKSVTESIYQFLMLTKTSWTVPLLLKLLDSRANSGMKKPYCTGTYRYDKE